MRQKSRSTWMLGSLLFASASGCLLVAPLDDVPTPSSDHGGTAGAPQGGTKQGGSSGSSSVVPEAGMGGDDTLPQGGKPPTPTTCTTNVECIARERDEPAICRPSDHTCVALKTLECPVAVGNVANPNAIVFGAFATINKGAPEDNSIIWAHQLAMEELSGDNFNGLPGGPKNAYRPLVMVVCDNVVDVDTGLTHLLDEVQVPAILATLQPGDLLRAYKDHPDRDVFYLSPVPVTAPIVSEPDNGHIWSLLGQPSDFVPTYKALLAKSETYVRGIQTPEEKLQPLRVALVTTGDAFDSELADALKTELRFNDKTPIDNGENFNLVKIGDNPNFKKLADDLAGWKPDIVVSAAGVPFLMTNGLQQQLEDDWILYAGGKRPPFYILSPWDAGNLNELVGRINGRLEREPNVSANERYVGVAIASATDRTLQNAYAFSLRSEHKDAVVDTANYYDATYYMAYAMLAANQPTGLTGSGIVNGMKRLLSGDPLAIGPSNINQAFMTLSDKSSTLQIQSTMGPPGFDPATGVRQVDGAVFCFSRSANAAKLQSDVLRYDRSQKKLIGTTFPCISGFFP